MFNHYSTFGKNLFHLQISGGEPTLWPELGSFIEQIKSEHNVYVSLISNGSRTLRWWKEYGDSIDNAVLSFHVRQANIEHHIKVADTLFEFGKKVTVLVLMDPTCFVDSVDALHFIKKNSKHNWFLEGKEIVSYLPYTSEQKKFLKKSLHNRPDLIWFAKNIHLAFDGSLRWIQSLATDDKKVIPIFATSQTYINKDITNFENYQCDIGVESIFISHDGDIRGACGQKLFGLDYYSNILSDDFVNQFTHLIQATMCEMTSCLCAPETHISKFILS